MPIDHRGTGMNRGFAYVDYETADDAAKAQKHMDGGAFSCQLLVLIDTTNTY